MDNPKKITLATIKSFIRKNPDLLIEIKTSFDGMVDCCMPSGITGFARVEKTEEFMENTLGVKGAWFVGGSRDRFTAFERGGVRGYEIRNCCGSFALGVAA